MDKHTETLIKQIKLLGQEVIDRAGNLVADNDLRTSFEVRFIFEPNAIPYIECSSTYYSRLIMDEYDNVGRCEADEE